MPVPAVGATRAAVAPPLSLVPRGPVQGTPCTGNAFPLLPGASIGLTVCGNSPVANAQPTSLARETIRLFPLRSVCPLGTPYPAMVVAVQQRLQPLPPASDRGSG